MTQDVVTVRTLLDTMVEVAVDRQIAESAGAIRRDHDRTPDAIVAATALGLGVPMVTRNSRHFHGVTGLMGRAQPQP